MPDDATPTGESGPSSPSDPWSAGPPGNNIETYTPRDCDVEHGLEVVGIVTAENGPHPGRDAAEQRRQTAQGVGEGKPAVMRRP